MYQERTNELLDVEMLNKRLKARRSADEPESDEHGGAAAAAEE